MTNNVHGGPENNKAPAIEKILEESDGDANGTSPLYVYSSTFASEPSYDDLLGALSLIIWTVTLMVSIKYVLIVLHADDEGEGGTFAIYSLLSRYVGFFSSS
ncbi:MAG: hypothetical protein Q9205_007271 [Flavoplaca limonia]